MIPFKKIVLASNNAGKLREFKQLFDAYDLQIIPQGELGVDDAVEDGLSFIENAIIKARHATSITGLPAIADDSGLEVDALNGEPGIYSARYAGEHGNDAANNQKVIKRLQGVAEAQRSARFHCVLVFLRHEHDPTPLVCHGSWEGRMLEASRGEGGFGYDPLFWVPEKQCASAELNKEVKNKISHRAQALKKLMAEFQQRYA